MTEENLKVDRSAARALFCAAWQNAHKAGAGMSPT